MQQLSRPAPRCVVALAVALCAISVAQAAVLKRTGAAGASRVAIAQNTSAPHNAVLLRNRACVGCAPDSASSMGYDATQGNRGLSVGDEDAQCHPRCHWSCGSTACDESCDPVCAPPRCETACAPVNLATCTQKCDPPKCAVVCPSTHCAGGSCPRCKTVCTPPRCQTICQEQCESKCSDPQCTWRCKPTQCDQPKCVLQCNGPKVCGFDNLNARPPPFETGMRVMSQGLAALDPSALAPTGGSMAPAAPASPSAAPPAR